MRNVLIVVDMQNDFIDGALGTNEAQKIVPNVENFIKNFDGEVIFTRDTHTEDYLNTSEGQKLPVIHCVRDSLGWQIKDSLLKYATDLIFDKPTFGSVELSQYLYNENQTKKIDSITLLGLCTDICVISNAIMIKAFLPEVSINVKADCCAGVSVQSHNNALSAMQMCQINII